MAADPLSIESAAFWARLGAAALCGCIIGIERQLRGKAAGVRTCTLICLGTEVFVALGASFPTNQADPTRALGQVITGIGFLGAGAILAREGRILGLTSAAVIWMLAALGATIGLGHIGAALILTMVTLVVLIGVEMLETGWARLHKGSMDRSLENLELRTSGALRLEDPPGYREP